MGNFRPATWIRHKRPARKHNSFRQQLPTPGAQTTRFRRPMIPTQGKSGAEAGEGVVNLRRSNHILAPAQPQKSRECGVLDEASFRRMIALERKRTERSRKPVLLMLLDSGNCLPFDKTCRVLSNILSALSLSTRDTDVTGWYKDQSVVGVMFTDIGIDDHGEILATMMHRVSQTMRNNLSLEKFSQIGISMHVFPQ